MITFGQIIKKARDYEQWTQEELAAKLKPKPVTGEYITKIEKGYIPSINVIESLCDALDLDKEEMLRIALRESDPVTFKAFQGEGKHSIASESTAEYFTATEQKYIDSLVKILRSEDESAKVYIKGALDLMIKTIEAKQKKTKVA